MQLFDRLLTREHLRVDAAEQREWRVLCLSYAEGTSRSTRVSFASESRARAWVQGVHEWNILGVRNRTIGILIPQKHALLRSGLVWGRWQFSIARSSCILFV